MKLDIVAPGVPQSPNSTLIGEVEIPPNPRMPKDEKQGVPIEDLVFV